VPKTGKGLGVFILPRPCISISLVNPTDAQKAL
jgi:hypothetical protein